MDQLGYIDVTYNLPSGESIATTTVSGQPVTTLTGDEISLTLPAGSNIAVDAMGHPESLVNGQYTVIPPEAIVGNTYRYFLSPKAGSGGSTMAVNQLFADGQVTVNFNSTNLTIQTAGTTGTTTVSLQPSAETFTVSGGASTEASSSNAITVGPLSLSGPSLGLAGVNFTAGELDLTVAIGVASASLNFGSGQSGSGITAALTNVLGTFDVDVNVSKLLSAIVSKNASAILDAFSVPGSFGLNIGGLTITVPNALVITASGIAFNYNPAFNSNAAPTAETTHGTDGKAHQKYLTINSGSVTLPSFGITASISPYSSTQTGTIPGLTIWDNGFTIGTAAVTATGPFSLAGILTFNDLTVSVSDLDVVFGQAIVFNGSVSISTTGATFLPGKPVSASISSSTPGNPAASATLQFNDGEVQDVIFSVDTFSVKISSYVTFIGHNITLDTGAGPDQPIVTIGSVGATVTLGSVALTGQAENFEFLGNGSFVPLAGFGVVLSLGSATGGSFMWPSWLPIQITELGVQWPNGITTDPTDMLITLSANVTGIQGMAGLTFSGSIQGVQIDTSLLLAGQFPIVGIGAFGVSVAGDMFGGEVNASLVGGIVKLDAHGNMIADTDTTTPVASRVFFVGISGGFAFSGLSGFTIQLGLSSLGPLDVQISADLPEGILLDPDTGLSINDFTAGVKFFTSLPSISDPMQLNGPAFQVPSVGAVSTAQWLPSLEAQVVAQYQAIQKNPSLGGFLAAFTQPMTIIGSARFTRFTPASNSSTARSPSSCRPTASSWSPERSTSPTTRFRSPASSMPTCRRLPRAA